MSDDVKDLLTLDPDEIPTDLEEINRMISEGGDFADEQSDTPGATDGEETSKEEKGEEVSESDPVVVSRDGKHEIPFSVLESTRRQLAEANARMAQMEERLRSAEGNAPKQKQEEETPSDEGYQEALLDDFPALKPFIEDQRSLKEKLKALESQLADQRTHAAAQEAEAVQAFVDANPDLAKWQAEDPERWAAAIAADQQLQQLTATRGLSTPDRLSRVVDVVRSAYGETTKPAPATLKKPPPEPRKAPPTSLSDIPGGNAPDTKSNEDAFLDLSVGAMQAKLETMSPKQMDEFFSRFG